MVVALNPPFLYLFSFEENVFFRIYTSKRLMNVQLKLGAHERKQLRKKSCEAVSSAVFSHVRVHFGEAKLSNIIDICLTIS